MTDPLAEPELLTLPSGAVVSRWVVGKAQSVVVLQHGFGEHVGRFVTQHRGLVRHLVADGHEVWGLDMLGHGRSPGRRAVTDVRRVVEDHRVVRGLASSGVPTFLLGHSLGGLVTAASAADDPGDVDGVVLLSPALPVPPPAWLLRPLLAFGSMIPALRLTWMAQPPARLSRSPGHEEATRADPRMDMGALTARTGATALAVASTVWPQLAGWRLPTLALHGTDDAHTDPQGSRRFAVAAGRENVELHLVGGALHELLADLDGDLVLERVLTWLRSRRADVAPGGRPAPE